jgi:NADPH:quinone reductase-like Zn-dependent oxidoreductase
MIYGVDLILNSIVGKMFEQDFTVLASMGKIIWFGFAAGYLEDNLTESLGNGFMKSVGVRTFTLYNILEDSKLYRNTMNTLVQHLVDGKLILRYTKK